MGFRPAPGRAATCVTRYPEDFGAARDGATDDAAAIEAAIVSAVVACIADATFLCKVVFSSGIYQATRATVKGGATLGNAQIPLPVVDPDASQKVTLILEGPGDPLGWLHWHQLTPQRSGALIRTTLTGQTPDGTWGSPSVIGGPTAQIDGDDEFSNMLVVIDGLAVTAPIDPSVIAVDLRRCAQAHIKALKCLADGIPATIAGPLNGNGVGLYMPSINNNALAKIDCFGCEGFYYSLGCSDHLAADWLGLIYTNTAIFIKSPPATAVHGIAIQYASIEAAGTCIEVSSSGGAQMPVSIRIDTETLSGTAIKDTDNALRGEIFWASNDEADPSVNGAANVKITNVHPNRGALTPALPASTVAATAIFRDMALTVSGGTVTVITVDGVATGLTSGTVIVPSGKTFAITYSVAPTLRAVVL